MKERREGEEGRRGGREKRTRNAHARACTHVKFAGARIKKANVEVQVLACVIASFMWT